MTALGAPPRLNPSTLRALSKGEFMVCSVDKCEALSVARTLCSGHYQRWGVHGSATAGRVEDRHGLSGTAEHGIWTQLRIRCNSPANPAYSDYGDRGIECCAGWGLFSNFLNDMGPRPGLEYSVDRINNDGNYSCDHCEECVANNWPANCRWATAKEQARNRRSNRLVEIDGTTKTAAEWAELAGVNYQTFMNRLSKGVIGNMLLEPPRAIEIHGVRKSLAEWSRDTGLSLKTLYYRSGKGWSGEQLISTPVHPRPQLRSPHS